MVDGEFTAVPLWLYAVLPYHATEEVFFAKDIVHYSPQITYFIVVNTYKYGSIGPH